MNTNQNNRFSNGVQGNPEWQTATQYDVNQGNFPAGFDVKQDNMNVPPSANMPPGLPPVQKVHCAAPQAPAWEYKIGIALLHSSTARKDAQEFFSAAWGRCGWIFVSENDGIFHFKRLKR